jgi:hypothetical protein
MRYLQKFLTRLAAHKELRMTDELYTFLCERNEDEWEAVVSASQVRGGTTGVSSGGAVAYNASSCGLRQQLAPMCPEHAPEQC